MHRAWQPAARCDLQTICHSRRGVTAIGAQHHISAPFRMPALPFAVDLWQDRRHQARRHLLGRDEMKYQISGTTMQTVEIDLAPGETVYSQTHAVAWMNDRISMETNTGGGFFAGLKRSLGGGSFFVTNFT